MGMSTSPGPSGVGSQQPGDNSSDTGSRQAGGNSSNTGGRDQSQQANNQSSDDDQGQTQANNQSSNGDQSQQTQANNQSSDDDQSQTQANNQSSNGDQSQQTQANNQSSDDDQSQTQANNQSSKGDGSQPSQANNVSSSGDGSQPSQANNVSPDQGSESKSKDLISEAKEATNFGKELIDADEKGIANYLKDQAKETIKDIGKAVDKELRVDSQLNALCDPCPPEMKSHVKPLVSAKDDNETTTIENNGNTSPKSILNIGEKLQELHDYLNGLWVNPLKDFK
jgi:hypothetical protein